MTLIIVFFSPSSWTARKTKQSLLVPGFSCT